MLHENHHKKFKSAFICGLLVIGIAPRLIFPQSLNSIRANNQIWGPGLDIILLIDVSFSAVPQNDDDHLSTHRAKLAELVVNNLKVFNNNSIGDRLAIIAFADTAVQVFPINGFYEVVGFYPALPRLINENYNSCIVGRHPNLYSLNRKKTNLVAALRFTRAKIEREHNTMEGAERERSRLIVLISDGIQDNTNEGGASRGSLVDREAIARSISDLLDQDPRVRLVFFHQPCKWKDIDSFEYALAPDWAKICKELSETFNGRLDYFAPDSISGKQIVAQQAFLKSRWAVMDTNDAIIDVQADAPFKLVRHESFYSLYGKIAFTGSKLPFDYLWVSIEADTFQVEDSQLQALSHHEIVLPSLRDRRSLVDSNLSLAIARQAFNVNLLDSEERILKILPIRGSLPLRGQESVTFVQVRNSDRTIISVDNSSGIAHAKIEYQEDTFLSELSYILAFLPLLVIAAILILAKVLAGLRLYFGLMKLGWEMHYSLERKSDGKKIFEDKRNFNGNVKIDIPDAFGEMVSAPPWIKVRPLGKNHLVIEKQIVSHSSAGQTKTHTTQTFLSENEKEISSNEFLYVLRAEPKEYVSDFGKEVEIGVRPYLRDGRGEVIFYNLKLRLTNAGFRRIVSSWFDYEGVMCPVEKLVSFLGILTAGAIVWQRAFDPLVFELYPVHFYIKAVLVLFCVFPIGILKPGYLMRILFSIKTELDKG